MPTMLSALVRSVKGDSTKPFYHVTCVDGRWDCDCAAYRYCRKAPKSCKHVAAVQAGNVAPVIIEQRAESESDPFARVKRGRDLGR